MKPFTYLIGWSKMNKFYYGVRYAAGCHPDELWTVYFTSSGLVKELRSEHGEPDIVNIRKTFDTVREARDWEERVLKRMKVVIREDFINQNDRMAPPIRYGKRDASVGVKISAALKGKPKSKQHRANLSKAISKYFDTHDGHNLGKSMSEEAKQKLREKNTGKKANSNTKQKMSANHKSKQSGFVFVQSEEAKQKIRNARATQIITDEHKLNISIANKGKPKAKITCPYCFKEGGIGAMKRWHFDNCKENM